MKVVDGMRGVLRALPEPAPPRAVDAIAALLGRTGALFLKELAPGVEHYFQHSSSATAPAGMERIMRLVPPGTVDGA
jgi:hypothetical protein